MNTTPKAGVAVLAVPKIYAVFNKREGKFLDGGLAYGDPELAAQRFKHALNSEDFAVLTMVPAAGVWVLPSLRWQEDMRGHLNEATKHLQANRWTEGFQAVQDALGLLDAAGAPEAVK